MFHGKCPNYFEECFLDIFPTVVHSILKKVARFAHQNLTLFKLFIHPHLKVANLNAVHVKFVRNRNSFEMHTTRFNLDVEDFPFQGITI